MRMIKILLVDDEKLIIYSLSRILKDGGFDVTCVENGKDALLAVQRDCFDICFLDVHLPDANGLELQKIIRKKCPLTRIIIMTAVSLTEAQVHSLNNNTCRYLPKPFELSQVQTLLADIANNQSVAQSET